MLQKSSIEQAVLKLKNNEIIILPTDTIYGLSAIFSYENQIRINRIKNADKLKPLIIMISNFKQVSEFAILSDEIKELLESKIPTTVIIKGIKNVAIRLIKRNDIKSIIDITGPIYSTSVNVHGQEPLADYNDLKSFNNGIELFWDEKLESQPSRIYNTITKKWVR